MQSPLLLIGSALHFEHDRTHRPVIDELDDEIRAVLRRLCFGEIRRADARLLERRQVHVQHVAHELGCELGRLRNSRINAS